MSGETLENADNDDNLIHITYTAPFQVKLHSALTWDKRK